MELNEQQKQAVNYQGEALNILVTAGAGCGKTRTIISRAAQLCSSGTDVSRILIMTFTNRAARELKLRLKAEIGMGASQLQAGTFHAFCLKVMTQLPKSFGLTGLSIIDADDQNSLMVMLRKQLVKTERRARRGLPKSKQLLSYYSYSRNTCRQPREYLMHTTDLEPEDLESCCTLFDQYQAAKQERGYLDYDDLLQLFSDTLEQKPPLRRAVCTLFDEVLVDEMQDTNPIQFSILRHFAAERVRLFCVGDPAQSIYRFRGAEFQHIYQFEQLFGSSTTITLSLNYRSYQEILDLSNWLLSGSSYDYDKELTAVRGTCGYLPRVEDFESAGEEASWIADEIQQRDEQGMALKDMMILYRTGYDAKHLEAELIRRAIPYRFIGGTVLTRSSHVRDVMALLRIVRNERDDLAWMRYLQLWPRIGEKTAQKILQGLTGDTGQQLLGDLTKLLAEHHKAIDAYQATIDQFPVPKKCVTAVIRHLAPVLKERYDNWQQRSKDLELLIRVAENYTSTEEFIDDFTLEPLNDTEILKNSTDDAVTLITVHSAKGTEAPVCFVAGANQANYPHHRSLGDLEAEEEERRVLYVALTRAQNELIITRSSFHRNAFWVSSSPAKGEHYFLSDIPEQLVRRELHGWNPENPGGLGALEDIF
ncbi:MAG: ATP-dependent helicase [Spirochaetia bacterium]|nr:ATP-dependent helicase [Spirochaetia bacterium]